MVGGMEPRKDIAAALAAWIAETPTRREAAGGDECVWSVRCPETGQGVCSDLGNVGLPGRPAPAHVVQAMLEEDILLQIERYGADIAYHASPPGGVARMYGIRPFESTIVLRRHIARSGTTAELALDTAAILAAYEALKTARATAPIGFHRGTNGGRKRDLAAIGYAKAETACGN